MKLQTHLLATLAVILISPLSAHAWAPSVVVPLDPSQGQLPESITLDDDGVAYLSMGPSVWRVTPDGSESPSVLARLPIPDDAFALGLKFGPDGYLYAGSGSLTPGSDASSIWRISPVTGAVEEYVHLDADGFANGLAFDRDGTLYVTDPFLGLVWEVPPGGGSASVWLADPLLEGDPANPAIILHAFGVDGIAFNRNHRAIYLGNFDLGLILRVPVERDGSAGEIEVVVSDSRLRGADGIAFDVTGTLYVAVNTQDQIATVDRWGDVDIIAQGGALDGPSSLVFGNRGWGRLTVYIANFAITAAVTGGVPDPSVARMFVGRPGLRLP